MAPRGRRSEAAEPQAFHEFGVRGRKTGVSIPSRTQVDEHGFQPLESIFSSPQKPSAAAEENDESGSEDMEIASSAGPGPRTLLKERHIQYPIPKSRSPLKTHLNSPARRNPHLDRMSSPSAASYSDDRDATVTRRLDFAAKPSRLRPNGPGKSNGVHAAHANIDEEEEEDVEEEADAMDIPGGGEELDDDDEPPEPLDDEEVEEEVPTPPRSRGRKKLSEALPPSEDEPELFQDEEDEEEVDPVPVPKAKKNAAVPAKPPAKPPPAARGRKKRAAPEIDTEEKDGDEQDQRQAKRPRGTKQPDKTSPKRPVSSRSTASVQPAKPRGRPRGRPKKTALAEGDEAGETSFMALQKGPPLPKRRGLVSVHHDPDAVHQTRSGRHSYRPLGWWKGEQVVTEDESRSDMFTKDRRDFVLGSVKEIIRVPEDMAPSRRAPRSKTRTKAKARGAVEAVAEDEELEPWETYPGTIDGEIIVWEPEHELQPPADEEEVQIVDEQIAVSADALQTKDIKDASFRFAKTLTTPFMGAGIVDLPPGTEKRPKNSRKMHMVFFVHYGKVAVTVNDVHFRISAGGQWFVPRGNYYSITNDYENPARVFFSQGCEVAVQPTEDTTYV